MQAIHTKYLPCTDTMGSRIKATCSSGSITIGYPHELSGELVHFKAVKALCEKLNWPELPTIWGGLKNGDMVFCFENSKVDIDKYK